MYTFTVVIAENVAFHRPQDVVIFVVGGTTYEEARSVALYNAANPGVRFFLGGSVVLNSKRYEMCVNVLFLFHIIIWRWICPWFWKPSCFCTDFSNFDVLQVS